MAEPQPRARGRHRDHYFNGDSYHRGRSAVYSQKDYEAEFWMGRLVNSCSVGVVIRSDHHSVSRYIISLQSRFWVKLGS